MIYCRATKNRASSTSNTKPARTSQPKSCTKKVQSETATQAVALSERTEPSKDRFVQSRTTLNDRLVRRLVLATFHVGSDGKTAHQRIRGKPFNQQIAAFGEQILFKRHKTTGPQQKLAVNWMDGCWPGFKTRTEEHTVSNNAAVVTCRSIRKRNREERWNRELLLGMLGKH